MSDKGHNRWFIAAMGTVLQLCIGTVYAWSYFQNPLVKTYNWSNTEVAWIFSLTIFCLSLSAAFGGSRLPRYGPRKLAMLGGVLFGVGYLVGALALHLKSLPLLYLGYGVIGGSGIGLAYVTPVATVAKWFPDKKGLATGMVIMGFGLGAAMMSKLFAPILMSVFDGNIVLVFALLGIIFLLLTVPVASFMRNPPDGWVPAGFQQEEAKSAGGELADVAADYTARRALLSSKFSMMWTILFCNTTAGIMFISFQSPMIQELWSKKDPALSVAELASYGAMLIAASSVFNGLGRFFWGSISDHIGRLTAFRLMLATQLAVFIMLGYIDNPWIFGALVCYALLCYGGGFGARPSFILDVFNARLMPVIYGAILTAWGFAGIAGPQIVAYVRDNYPENASSYAFNIGACFLVAGLVVAMVLSEKPFSPKMTVDG